MDPNHQPGPSPDPSKGQPPLQRVTHDPMDEQRRFGGGPAAPPSGYPMPPSDAAATRPPFGAGTAFPPSSAERTEEAPSASSAASLPTEMTTTTSTNASAPKPDPWAHLKAAPFSSPSSAKATVHRPPIPTTAAHGAEAPESTESAVGPPGVGGPLGGAPPPHHMPPTAAGPTAPASSQLSQFPSARPSPQQSPLGPQGQKPPPAKLQDTRSPALQRHPAGPPPAHAGSAMKAGQPPPGAPGAGGIPPQPAGMPPGVEGPRPGGAAGPPPNPPHPAGPMGVMRELRVEDALLYLDDVKREFRDQPTVYNEFLTIMKNFKTQAVDTPGVIARVSKLFRGYNKLILGFNTFLPEGYKISLADLQRREALMKAEEERERAERQAQLRLEQQAAAQAAEAPRHGPSPPEASSQLGLAAAAAAPAGPVAAPLAHAVPSVNQEAQPMDTEPQSSPGREQQRDGGSPGKKQGQPDARAKPRPAQKKPPQPPPPQQQHQAVEFDHAISYVTQIKRRFANDPNTYHSFLEILHTYQKEQRGIKEVLEQVAHLFQDHPDLLKEFTFFLPDAVQEQAKERLHRAAAESESRLAREREAQLQRYHNQQDGAGGQQVVDMTGRKVPMVDGATAGRKRAFDGQFASASQPESFVYNSAVERQFFDLAKEALSSYSRDGGQAWAEFMKCLDMYAQEILSRTEMLTFVEPLLGKRNAKLFEEFKRILAGAGSTTGPTPPLEDAWYSVPLSEIDFSRCRRCTPSYRALPRDYPAPPCTERNEEEAKVLNDIWVSLPVGSEESYTFRHMRRNNYEEILFRCEDERFEIDMVIDSNAATLQRLMPIAEEIARLSVEEVVGDEFSMKNPSEGSGLAGKRFQYTFDKSVLGVIHRNTISRIYGDSGPEMLDLMVKNPVVAIPLVVERLKQKDREWKKVRERLNENWSVLAEANYYKSLDHRSLTWRTTDKRATSTRTLVSEIKDRSLHRGKEGKEALRQKLDKAKEEHGLFFEVTMKDTLVQDLDLTFLPKPDRLLFTPHLSVLYENNSWAQRDAYRVLAFALERGATSPHDKERCHRLWSEFLGPFFGLSLDWMFAPAVAYQENPSRHDTKMVPATPVVVSEEEEEDSMEDDTEMNARDVTEEVDPSKSSEGSSKGVDDLKDYHPLPRGSTVCTLYGEGIVKDFRPSSQMYVVDLPFGTAYLRASTVLCSLLPAEKSNYTKNLRSDDRSRLGRPTDHLAIGKQPLFLVFRLHQILVSRLNTAMKLAHSVGNDHSLCTLVEQMPGLSPEAAARRRYEAYLALLYALLDGGVGGAAEGGKYEDRVRSLLGHGAYELATMDKLIAHIWKNLQAVAQDETMWNLIQLYRRHRDAGSFQPEAFRQEAALLSDHEPMYAFQWCPMQDQDKGVLHFESLGVIAEDEEDEDVDGNEEEEPEKEEHSNKRPRRQ